MRNVFCGRLLRPLFLIFGVWQILSIGSEYAQAKDKKSGLFLGAGLGYGIVYKGAWGGEGGFNALGRFGFGLNEYLFIELEFDFHRLNESNEEIGPLVPPGYPGGSLAYYSVYKTSYLLASLQYGPYKGFYMRSGVGLVINKFADTQWEGEWGNYKFVGINIINEEAFAFGLSLGYEHRLTQHLALSLEGLFRSGGGTDSRTALGIEVVGIWYFKSP